VKYAPAFILYSSTIKSRRFCLCFVSDRMSGSDEMLYDPNTITQTSLKCYVDNQHLIFLSRPFTLHIITFAIVTESFIEKTLVIKETPASLKTRYGNEAKW
jgi:hypothetical protein